MRMNEDGMMTPSQLRPACVSLWHKRHLHLHKGATKFEKVRCTDSRKEESNVE